MSFQLKRKVISLPPDPPSVNNDNNNYFCIKYCPKGLDHLTTMFKNINNSYKSHKNTEIKLRYRKLVT